MLSERTQINEHIQKYMSASGYQLSSKSKHYHALDSFVFEYFNTGGMKDNLKIEINYMLRCHILTTSRRAVNLPWNNKQTTVLSIDPIEIFAAKAVALLHRSAPRDLYDIFNLQRFGLFDDEQETVFRKCVMFYTAIASENVSEQFSFDVIGNISERKIKTSLTPVLRSGSHFDLGVAQAQVKDYLQSILVPTEKELSFWKAFANKQYQPELLFDDSDILMRISEHPMAVWKCRETNN